MLISMIRRERKFNDVGVRGDNCWRNVLVRKEGREIREEMEELVLDRIRVIYSNWT